MLSFLLFWSCLHIAPHGWSKMCIASNIKGSGFRKIWMSWLYSLVNSIKNHTFFFIYHLVGQRNTLKQSLTDQAVLIRTRVIYLMNYLQVISKSECHESTYAFWISSIKHHIFALSTIWMVKKIPLNNFWQTRLYESGYIKTWI